MAPRVPDDSPDGEESVLDGGAVGGLLVRGGAVRFASIAGMAALSVIMAAVLTRHLGVSRFGRYTTVMSVVGVVAVVIDAGMGYIGTREYAILLGQERTDMMRDLLGLRVALSCAGVVVATAFAVVAGYNLPLVLGTVVASLATSVLIVLHTLQIPLANDLRLGIVSALELGRQTLWTLGVVVLAVVGAGVFPLLGITLPAYALMLLPAALLVRGRILVRLVLRPSVWPRLLRATATLSLATAIGQLYIYVGQIVTSLVASQHQSGLFALSFRVFVVTAGVPTVLATSALPVLARAAHNNRDRFVAGMQRSFEVAMLAGFGVAVVMSAGARFATSIVAGPKFAAAATVLSIQSFAMIASFLIACWSLGLLALRLHRSILVASGVALTVSVVLTLVLARADGARGSAIATIAGESTLALASLVALMRDGSAERPRMRIAVKLVPVTGVAAFVSLAFSMPSIARPFVAFAVYGAGALLTRAASPDLLALIPSRSLPN